MIYRDVPHAKGPTGWVVHGPFPARWVALFIAMVLLPLGVSTGFLAFGQDHLVCSSSQCTVTKHKPPFDDTTDTFSRAAFKRAEPSVTVTVTTGSKGGKTGVVMLHVNGETDRKLRSSDAKDAEATANEIRRALEADSPIDVTVRSSMAFFVVAPLAILAAIASLLSFFRGIGRMRLTLVRTGAALRVRRSIFGIPISTSEVSLDGVVDVRVQTRSVTDFWTPKGRSTPGGRLVLVDRAGRPRPITNEFYRGETLHYRAAVDLRARLGFSPAPGGAEETLAQIAPVTVPLASRIGFAWAGMCCGSIAGPFLTVGFGHLVGILGPKNDMPGEWFIPGLAFGAIAGAVFAFRLSRPKLPR